jgi:hypothetical protein
MKIFRFTNDNLVYYLTDKFNDTSVSVLNQVSSSGVNAQEEKLITLVEIYI